VQKNKVPVPYSSPKNNVTEQFFHIKNNMWPGKMVKRFYTVYVSYEKWRKALCNKETD
jgi:hypothetical protein